MLNEVQDNKNNEKLLRMLHGSRGAVFSKRASLAAGGKVLTRSN